MTDLPMFDDPSPPDNVVAIEPRRRKKPAKRKAAVRVAAPKKARKARALPAPKRAVKKRKVAKRRGRPAGVPNKPKLVADTSSVATIIGVHAQIESSLSRLSPAERKAMLECLK